MESETKPDVQPVEAQEQTKRERPASPAAAEPNEEDAMNDSNPTKKPKFEKKSKKDYKPKSPYPGRGKNYADRPQLTEEERKAKAEERERLRVERRIADEERLENRDEGDRRLPKRRCALLMGWVRPRTSFKIEADGQILWIRLFWYADVSAPSSRKVSLIIQPERRRYNRGRDVQGPGQSRRSIRCKCSRPP
jgi:hypothetical protein